MWSINLQLMPRNRNLRRPYYDLWILPTSVTLILKQWRDSSTDSFAIHSSVPGPREGWCHDNSNAAPQLFISQILPNSLIHFSIMSPGKISSLNLVRPKIEWGGFGVLFIWRTGFFVFVYKENIFFCWL